MKPSQTQKKPVTASQFSKKRKSDPPAGWIGTVPHRSIIFVTACCCVIYKCTKCASLNIRLALAHLPKSILEVCQRSPQLCDNFGSESVMNIFAQLHSYTKRNGV